MAKHGLAAGRAVGVVVFQKSKKYQTREEWAEEAGRHGVDPQAGREEFGWSEQETKWGWEVERIEVWEEERRRGVGLREEQRVLRSIFCLSGEMDVKEAEALTYE